MRIAFVWTGLTSYMGDCWRALAAVPGVELRVIQDVSSGAAKSVAFEADEVMRGIAYELNGTRLLDGWMPDVIFAVGWRSAICRAVVCDRRFAGVPKVCCFDMPWRWKFRCLVAPLVLGGFLRRYQAAFVPGEVCARYVRWLGFRKIYRGLFGIDTRRFGGGEDWPCRSVESVEGRGRFEPCRSVESVEGEGKNLLCRSGEGVEGDGGVEGYFLYIGRDSSEKRLEDLRKAHAIYSERGGKLALRLYGKGLEGGFVKPEDVPGLMRGAAAFVLASDFDPWPLVLLEAMSAGCPVIASDRCTNRPELGKNWRVFRVGDVEALAGLMKNEELRTKNESERRMEREENLALARQYDCERWAKRVVEIVRGLEPCRCVESVEVKGRDWPCRSVESVEGAGNGDGDDLPCRSVDV